MNSRYLILGILALAVIGGGALLMGSYSQNTQVSPTPASNAPVGGGPGNIPSSSEVKEFMVKGMLEVDPATGQKSPRFDTKEILVKKGDRVRVTFENVEGFHDFAIAEYSVKTKQIQVGQTDTIEFTADKTGTFEFICTVPTHKDKGMLGQLIVEE